MLPLQKIPPPGIQVRRAVEVMTDLIQAINSLDPEDPIRCHVLTPLILDVIEERRALADILHTVICVNYPDEITLQAAQRALYSIGWGHIRLKLKPPT